MKAFNEIERKFLVDVSKIDLNTANYKVFIMQGYLLRAENGSARVRIEILAHTNAEKDDVSNKIESFVMIKQKVNDQTNKEIPFHISFSEAFDLLEYNCSKPIIEKIRYVFIKDYAKWEIDVFQNHKEGLVLAEVELQNMSDTEIENLIIPDWVIREVTGESDYYNVNM